MKYLLQKPLQIIINSLLEFFNIYIIFRVGYAVGDQLCMSSVIRLINKQHPFKIVVISSFPELFENNPRVWRNYEVQVDYFGKFFVRILRFLTGKQLENFLFTNDNIVYEDFMLKDQSKLHLSQVHSLHFKTQINFNEISNEIYLSELEIEKYKKKFDIKRTYAVIQPDSRKTIYASNKKWGFDKYQKVVTSLKEIRWIQVGIHGDLLLNGVENYVGMTSIRELAFIIKNAEFVLADEGLLNHVASSVGSKSFVVFSGLTPIEIAQYDDTISIVNTPQVECSPCMLRTKCPKKNKYCTDKILVSQVINAITSH